MTAARSKPLVSIVIPCYNQARYLGEAIESALGQTHSPVEVIVVDDGSSDETARVARSHSSVQYLRQRNSGAPRARNAGLAASRGEFVLFLDADDRLLPEAVARGAAALAANPDWAFATGHVRLIANDGAVEGAPPQAHAEGDQFLALLRSNYIWSPGAVLYRRSVLESGGAFEPSARASADYELNIRVARQHPVGCHHAVVLEYRQHDANMSGDIAEMLRSAVSVRRAQRRFVAGDPVAEQAWKAGLDIVKADFGERLLDRVKCDVRTKGRRARAFLGVVRLAQYYPVGLLRTLAGGGGGSTATP